MTIMKCMFQCSSCGRRVTGDEVNCKYMLDDGKMGLGHVVEFEGSRFQCGPLEPLREPRLSDDVNTTDRQDELCWCGHSESEHYEYVLNGRPQTRCKACDPTAGAPPGNYALETGTLAHDMYFQADHDFEPEQR